MYPVSRAVGPLNPMRILQLGNNGSLYSFMRLWSCPTLRIPRFTPSVANASDARKSFSCSNLLLKSAEVTIQLAGPRSVVRWMMLLISRTLYMRAKFRSLKLTEAPAAVAKLWVDRIAAATRRSLRISRSTSATTSSAMRLRRVSSASMS